VARTKGTQPLTLIVVPHSERAPLSFRVAPWCLTLSVVGAMLLAMGGAVLTVRAYRLGQEVRELRLDHELQFAREQEMRSTILSQQEEVRELSTLVEGLGSELASVSALSSDVRELIGLPPAQPRLRPTPAVASLSPYGRAVPAEAEGGSTGAQGGQLTTTNPVRSMMSAVEMGQDVVEMQVTLPSMVRELLQLRTEVVERMERIEPEKRATLADLEKQLKLLAAAPHLWPTEARRLSSKYGYRELLGKVEFHKGIDIPVWHGTQVFATADGVVKKAGWQSGYGWTVEIEHALGFSTVYGHNSKLLVDVGDEVGAGAAIALSGNSGRSTGPHVHYEIRLDGVAVDPLRYLEMDAPVVVTN